MIPRVAEDIVTVGDERAHRGPTAGGGAGADDDAEAAVEAAPVQLGLGDREDAERVRIANVIVDEAVGGGGAAAPGGHAVDAKRRGTAATQPERRGG